MNRMFFFFTTPRRDMNVSVGQRIRRGLMGMACGAAALVCCTQLLASTLVNINTASANVIADALQGVGSVKAEAIVAHREANGLFKSTEDIMQVKGIGKATYEQIKAYLLIGGSTVDQSNKASAVDTGRSGTLARINTAKE